MWSRAGEVIAEHAACAHALGVCRPMSRLFEWAEIMIAPAELIDARKSLSLVASADPIFSAPGVADTRCPVLSLSPAAGA